MLAAGAALVGTALLAVDELFGGSGYYVLGRIGTSHTLSAPALQALHVQSSEGAPAGGGLFILLVTVAVVGIAHRALPRTLAWTALLLAVGLLTPVFFLASLLALLWIVAASVVLTVRPSQSATERPRRTEVAVAAG